MIYRQQPAHQPSNHQRTCPHRRHVTRHRHAHSLSIIIFICQIIQQYAAHLREYDSRTAGQQGPIRTLTASSSYIRAFRSCLVRQQIHAQRYRAVAPTHRLQLPTSAANMPLPAYAAAAPAVQQSIDISNPPGPQQQTRRTLPQRKLAAVVDIHHRRCYYYSVHKRPCSKAVTDSDD